VGYTGICFGPIDPTDRSVKTHKSRLTTVAHEFTHILGMNSYDFPFYYSHVTGAPRTPRDEWNRPPETEMLCVDGSRQFVTTASEDVIKASTTANGYVAYEVVTETVRNVVRNQFDCPTINGARLENQPTASQDIDCFGSHWDHVSLHLIS
jgi:leishmanolysin-like peptidase